MAMVKTSRISIDATRNVHDVGYDKLGNAFCNQINHHHHKYGDEHWPERSKNGYITFWDRYLGMSTSHKVAVKSGESYEDFWTRVKIAENRGTIEVMGTSTYSVKDAEILAKELGEKPVIQVMDKGALVGSSYVVDGKTVYPYGKSVSAGNEKGIMAGASMALVAVLFAIGYLIFARGK